MLGAAHVSGGDYNIIPGEYLLRGKTSGGFNFFSARASEAVFNIAAHFVRRINDANQHFPVRNFRLIERGFSQFGSLVETSSVIIVATIAPIIVSS